MPLLDGTRIVRSKIHGYGMLATRPFRAAERICDSDGVLYLEGETFDDTYAVVVSGAGSGKGARLFFDLVCQTRWINHSCQPNLRIQSRWDVERGELRVWWIARRDVDPGEELTFDYAYSPELAQPCHCGAANCRGVIVDDEPEELAKLPEKFRALWRGPPLPPLAQDR